MIKATNRVAIYLRVSNLDQTTANQERELREVASRMGCEVVKIYRDHGVSGAKGGRNSIAYAATPPSASSMPSWHGASIA
jgi:DNA invertase Pin-like site-specific DNA recombinase